MMIGDSHHPYHTLTRNPTVYNPPWSAHTDPTATITPSYNSSSPTPRSPLSVMTTANGNGSFSPTSSPTAKYNDALLTALSRYLPSNEQDDGLGAFPNSDEFRMYEFKVRGCTRPKAHDWTECPFAHHGEKARRRDPRRYSYSGTACTDFRKGSCRRGDACEFAHGVFECWLHPTRYRTQACKDGPDCTRRVCFFAHAPDQLRVNIGSEPDPFGKSYGPGSGPVNELVASIRNMQLSKVKSMPTHRSAWNSVKVDVPGSPRIGSGFNSLPTTPTQPWGARYLDAWGEEEKMERVESGRELRARMFEKLSKENPLGGPEPAGLGPDVGWVTELVTENRFI